jgi:uncharacterized protein YndB with AHSA1/START domain
MNTNDQYGTFNGPGEVRIVRLLPGPVERIWDYLTVPEKRARWICGGVLEPKPGGKVEFAMHHKNLAPHETPPLEYARVQDPGVTFDGKVLRCEPPTLLVITFGSDDSVVTFELTPHGRQVRLVLTHRTEGAGERAELGNYASGWHTHLGLLFAGLNGSPRPPFWATHAKLKTHYDTVLRSLGERQGEPLR